MNRDYITNKVKAVLAFAKRMAVRTIEYLKVAKMEWIIILSAFVLDLVIKAIVENCLDYGEIITIVPYVLNIHKIHNSSAAFGASFLKDLLGPVGARIFFCVFAVAASVAFALVLIKNKGKSRVLRISLALFIAGAMGNCIDRMALGYVRDFAEFIYLGMTIRGSKTWPYIFNIADVALVVGVMLMIVYFLFLYRDSDKKGLEANTEALDIVLSDAETSDDGTETDAPVEARADAQNVAANEVQRDGGEDKPDGGAEQ